MAYIAADKIIVRLRELLQDGDGDIRAILATRFSGGLTPGLPDEEARRRGLPTEKPIEIELHGPLPHPNRLTGAGNLQIHHVDAYIPVVRTVAVDGQVDDSIRDAVRAQAVIDGSAIEQALEWPGNLAQTEAAEATGMIGAKYLGSVRARLKGATGAAMDLTTEHRVRLTVTSSPASA